MKLVTVQIIFTRLLLIIFVQFKGFSQDQSFETATVPSNWKTSTGSLSTSSVHYKLGNQSLKWDWNANAVLIVSNLQSNGLVPSEVLGYFENMFRMWIYNTSKITDQPLVIEFYDSNGKLQFHYNLQTDFTGWRAASASYKFEMYGNKSSTNITTLKIKAPTKGSGTFYFDYIDYTMARNTYRSPDYQLPFINLDNGKHWSDIMYFQSLSKTVSATAPTSQEISDFNTVKQQYDALILGNAPSSSNVANAVNKYNNLAIKYADGIVTGKPIYGTDYSNAESCAAVDDYLHTLASDYKHNGTAASLTYFLNSIRYLLDQGYAEGSLVETIHHIGYRFRNISKAVHLMKSELETAGLWSEAQKMVEWYTAADIIWHPTAHDSNLDDALTRSLSVLGACLYKNSDEEKVQYLKGYTLYIQNWLTAYSKEGEGLKIDFTGFHHNTYYPLYTFGAYNTLSEVVKLISGGVYGISPEKKELFKNTLLLARVIMSNSDLPNSLSGRSPFAGISIEKSLKNLGLANPENAQLLGAYNYIYGGDSTTKAYAAETAPNGFWQVNYANLGAYRQSDWVADIKGFNKYFWGTEIYTSDNRFGRYQSYGAIEILYTNGYSNSGFNRNGWDWNKVPGATTILLPWNDLEAANNRQDETTNSNFAASLRFGTKDKYYINSNLEGNYGVFGMDFTQKAISSTHTESFKFKKSVFCFDGKLICLGSNISNNNTSHITVTNLFQNYLDTTSTPIVINNSETATFPYTNKTDIVINNWLIDAVNTGYYVKIGNAITIDRKSQISPNENGNGLFTNGNFASAFIDHGKKPRDATYEYVIIPETNALEMVAFSAAMETEETAFYKVVQKNKIAHIVSYKNMVGYSFFEAGSYTNSTPIKSNNAPCLVMISEVENDLDITLVNPDLSFETNNGESQITTATLVLNGIWNLNNTNGIVNLTRGTDETTLIIEAKDGLPVDIELFRVVSSVLSPIFEIKTTSETCTDKNNGIITINAQTELNYTATISGTTVNGTKVSEQNYPFTKATGLQINDLKPGKYSVCISVNSNDFKQCYTIQIDEAVKLELKSEITTNEVLINIVKGTAPFKVVVNGLEFLETRVPSFLVTIEPGDVLEVKTAMACEGVFLEKITKDEAVVVYPNPTRDFFYINILDSTIEIQNIKLFDVMGRLVLTQQNNQTVNVSNLKKGIYFLKIGTKEGTSISKKVFVE